MGTGGLLTASQLPPANLLFDEALPIRRRTQAAELLRLTHASSVVSSPAPVCLRQLVRWRLLGPQWRAHRRPG